MIFTPFFLNPVDTYNIKTDHNNLPCQELQLHLNAINTASVPSIPAHLLFCTMLKAFGPFPNGLPHPKLVIQVWIMNCVPMCTSDALTICINTIYVHRLQSKCDEWLEAVTQKYTENTRNLKNYIYHNLQIELILHNSISTVLYSRFSKENMTLQNPWKQCS